MNYLNNKSRLRHPLFFSLLMPIVVSASISSNTSYAQENLPTCKLIATGGTIAMKIDPETNAPVPALSGDDLIQSIPEIANIANLIVENPFNVPSDYMDPEKWIEVHKLVSDAISDDSISGVIISHGTDTLEETAYFLDLTIDSDKPIILVGAQKNASESDFDGPRNLLNASKLCISEEAKGKGAMIVLNSQINAAREATKTHTSDVETFKSGDFGFLGNIDHDRIIFGRAPLRRQHIALQNETLSRVDIIPMYAGVDGTLLDAAVEAGAKGVVIQALGWGNINIPLFESVKAAIEKDVIVVISTRVPNGRVLPVYGFEGGGKTLKDAGAIFADDLSPQKARILLMLALQNETNAANIQSLYDK